MGGRSNSTHLQKQRRNRRVGIIQTILHRANNLQNLGPTNRKKTIKNPAHHNEIATIWVQGTSVNIWCHRKTRIIPRQIRQEHTNRPDGSNKSIRQSKSNNIADNSLQKGPPIDMITHIRRGHQNTTLIPKTKGEYGQATTTNFGVSQGSAISALLFIIYHDDMKEDYQALNYKA